MILVIQSVSQEFTKNGAEYRKITGVTDKGQQTTKSVFNNLEAKWEMLEENATVELKLEQKGQFWNVTDVLPVLAPEATAPIPQERQVEEPTDKELESLDKAMSEEERIDRGSFAKFVVDARTHDIHRQGALKCSTRLACSGLIKIGELLSYSDRLLKYLDGE